MTVEPTVAAQPRQCPNRPAFDDRAPIVDEAIECQVVACGDPARQPHFLQRHRTGVSAVPWILCAESEDDVLLIGDEIVRGGR